MNFIGLSLFSLFFYSGKIAVKEEEGKSRKEKSIGCVQNINRYLHTKTKPSDHPFLLRSLPPPAFNPGTLSYAVL
jgi:hypothetical protein